ncbi:endonuclease/exonuclease/phosphatase (EEP) superfamily protein YafD [Arthrobacter stackebrandtii]|uniref:Endonuclease/exonuclease/phosphatase (EEP) superfamily protein YafD n=1 Tax=Arthrobacter stackebrandtii TaxID=272161 RepID=A0ABS4YTV3_9MICC|nr:endonuclease/exonuclease/phosphatase family protein [Arthrobacter stackebrandtii]MBP2412223.1 endonuclease/exonuclease/phosphatase (EEP) superfamily protein YafD [Arthrobacter stackebrandtii]PYH02009.1 endonuclease [Arthrobacter stackebrandtii]
MNQVSRRSVVRGIAGAAALGALSAAGAGSAAAAAPDRNPLKVLVLNAWHGGKQVPGGVGMVADIIRESGATLAFIPEANETTPDIVARLNASGLNYQYKITGDNAIISAHPISEATAMPYMTKAVVTVGSVEVAAYAAHLQYQWYATYLPRGYGAGVPNGEFSEFGWNKMPGGPVTDAAAVARVNDASGRPQVIARFIEDARKERQLGRAVILGGDFNEPSTLDWTRRTSRLFDHNGVVLQWGTTQALQEAGFVDAYRRQHPNPVTHPGFTWPSDNPHVTTGQLTWAPEADERDRIDYIFHHPDPRLKLQDAQVVGPQTSIVRNQRVAESGKDPFVLADMPWPTDHKGVLASYTVRG